MGPGRFRRNVLGDREQRSVRMAERAVVLEFFPTTGRKEKIWEALWRTQKTIALKKRSSSLQGVCESGECEFAPRPPILGQYSPSGGLGDKVAEKKPDKYRKGKTGLDQRSITKKKKMIF